MTTMKQRASSLAHHLAAVLLLHSDSLFTVLASIAAASSISMLLSTTGHQGYKARIQGHRLSGGPGPTIIIIIIATTNITNRPNTTPPPASSSQPVRDPGKETSP
uniref:Putative secreted peptide n=1 Tax=Anopheles braziliensis TaxID=58242 RepID=A0A2M3ZVL4_9DIPT